ncbi:hypothetical protein GUJ93_ZPchr0013g36556 [Zizania palustris]|uniref:Uncharacterized protein n=1 Tax=Zizania palustris TaxID=103762 RepID=A0A8J5X263_ZIZPA|nr:hypothetical protein GUJ93_ZPchr0013g36556 [Zizania palustris]
MEGIIVMEACPMCHGPIKPGHRYESLFTRMKIVIDSMDSNDGILAVVASSSGTKQAAASDQENDGK